MTLTREEVEAEHAALKAENTAWREQVRALVARVQHLEGPAGHSGVELVQWTLVELGCDPEEVFMAKASRHVLSHPPEFRAEAIRLVRNTANLSARLATIWSSPAKRCGSRNIGVPRTGHAMELGRRHLHGMLDDTQTYLHAAHVLTCMHAAPGRATRVSCMCGPLPLSSHALAAETLTLHRKCTQSLLAPIPV